MGAAAALIPGIVGIAGGEYAGYKNRQKEAVDKADMGQFAKSLIESQQGPDPRLGGDVPNSMMSTNQLMARGAQRFPAVGQTIIANKLKQMGEAPAFPDYGNTPQEGINPTTGKPSLFVINKNTGQPTWLGITPSAKIDKPSDNILGYNDWKLTHPNGTMMQYEAAKAAATRAPTATPSTFDDENKLRGEFDKKTQDFTIIRDAYSNISTVASDASPAGDLSLIFSYMKLLDPGSTVREGEYATAQNAASVPETIRAKFNKAIAGETLTPGQRVDFVKQAGNIYSSKKKSFDEEVSRYTDLANQYKLAPSKIVYDRSNGIVKAVPVIPSVGFEQGGYIFTGGDPSKETSWKKK